MRRLSFIMAGITSCAAISLLAAITVVYHDYPTAVGIMWITVGFALLDCVFVLAINLTRRYELSLLLIPIVALVGLVAFVVFSAMLMLLDLLLLLTVLASGLAMNREWRTEPRVAPR